MIIILFIINELANKFQGKFERPGENTKKCQTFFVPVEKEVIKIDKDGNESVVTIPYEIKFIDRAKFMGTLSSNLHQIKCKDCDCFLEYKSVKDD